MKKYCLSQDTAAAAAAKSLQSCPTLCDPRDGSSPGSPVPGVLQARVLEWGAIAFSIDTANAVVKNPVPHCSLTPNSSIHYSKCFAPGLYPGPPGIASMATTPD